MGGYLPTFSKTAKSPGQRSTGILVNYPEAFSGSYLPSFYINWIFLNRAKAGYTQAQAF